MACKKWYMGTNTKMYKTIGQTNEFITRLQQLTADIDRSAFELFVIPSFTTLDSAGRNKQPGLLKLGAQNMGWAEEGQFTGEISPAHAAWASKSQVFHEQALNEQLRVAVLVP